MKKVIFIFSSLLLFFGCSEAVDSIGEANIKTQNVFRAYETSGDADAAYAWLFARHGEAPGHQVFITLVEWSTKHPDKFKALLEKLPQEHRTSFVVRYAFAVTDSGQDNDYKDAFGGLTDRIFTEISLKLKLIGKK